MARWLLGEAGGETGDELTASDGVGREDRQHRQDDGCEDRRHVDRERPLERPQRQRQDPLVRALREHEGEEEAVPHIEGVVDRHGDDRGLAQRHDERPQHAPIRGAVETHRLEELARHIAQEVDEDEHRERNSEADRGQDDRPQGVIEAQLHDEVIDRDDDALQRDGDPQEQQVEHAARQRRTTADDDVRRKQGHEHDRRDSNDGDEDGVVEVLAEVRGEHVLIRLDRRIRRDRQRIVGVVRRSRSKARDDHVIDRQDRDDEPDPAEEPTEDIGCLATSHVRHLPSGSPSSCCR